MLGININAVCGATPCTDLHASCAVSAVRPARLFDLADSMLVNFSGRTLARRIVLVQFRKTALLKIILKILQSFDNQKRLLRALEQR